MVLRLRWPSRSWIVQERPLLKDVCHETAVAERYPALSFGDRAKRNALAKHIRISIFDRSTATSIVYDVRSLRPSRAAAGVSRSVAVLNAQPQRANTAAKAVAAIVAEFCECVPALGERPRQLRVDLSAVGSAAAFGVKVLVGQQVAEFADRAIDRQLAVFQAIGRCSEKTVSPAVEGVRGRQRGLQGPATVAGPCMEPMQAAWPRRRMPVSRVLYPTAPASGAARQAACWASSAL